MTNDHLSFSQEQGYLPIPDSLKLEELPRQVRQEFVLCVIKAFGLEKSYARNKKVANLRKVLCDVWVEFLDQDPLSSYNMNESYRMLCYCSISN